MRSRTKIDPEVRASEENHKQSDLPPKVRPIVIYPFVQPKSLDSLVALYESLRKLRETDSRFLKPHTVVNLQTEHRTTGTRTKNPALRSSYESALRKIVAPVSHVDMTWSVDTCAMWLRGLGDAYLFSRSKGAVHDVFWLIPGDFDYSTKEGQEALRRIPDIPLRVLTNQCEICLGEISVPINSSKQLIDTYGTYGLLYNWFPAEAQGMREITDKPRTEFFALNWNTLEKALIDSRWYAYEQTLMILLQNMYGRTPGRNISKIDLGHIVDEESTRSSLAAAIQQVERTERALKLFWREKAEREARHDWKDEFRILDAQSESIRSAAMVILRMLLT